MDDDRSTNIFEPVKESNYDNIEKKEESDEEGPEEEKEKEEVSSRSEEEGEIEDGKQTMILASVTPESGE